MTEAGSLTAEQKRCALDLALRSQTFSRSEQLRAFLRYVCEAELDGKAGHLTEYAIAVDVLGRPPDFSASEDSSVRSRAYELRHKLEKLYALESPDAPVRIVIPKGSYVPHFLEREPDEIEPSLPKPKPEVPAIAVATERRGWWRSRWAVGAGYLLAAAIGAAVASSFLIQRSQLDSIDPALREAWGPLARPDANVVLCTATPLHLTVGPDSHEAFGSPSYPAPPEAYPLFRQHRPLAPGARLGLLFTDNVLGVGTMNAVVTVANRLREMGTGYQVLPERVAPISALRNRNAMLFGAPVDSDAITRVLANTPLTVDFEPSVKEFVIRDRERGEMLVPRKDASGEFSDVYGLLTVIGNRQSDAGPLATVVFAGVTSTGTQGAAEFFSSPRSMKELKARFVREGLTGFPPSYQVVVRCTFGNLLLLNYEYRMHRVLRDAKPD